MKKIFLLIISFSIISIGIEAQNFNPRSGKAQGPNVKSSLDFVSVITNSTTDVADSMFNWQIIELNLVLGWSFQMCDTEICLSNLVLGATNNFKLVKNGVGEMKASFLPKSIAGYGSAKIVIKSLKSAFIDTISVTGSAWTTAVKEIKQVKELSFFPNPAKDVLTIRYPSRENISVEIFNVLGVKIRTFNHTGNETELRIDDLQNGLYFLRFKDDGKIFSRSLTKIH